MPYESTSHSRWDCKYHVVFIPKCRRKELYGKIRKFLGPVFHEMARQKGYKIEEGYIAWFISFAKNNRHKLLQKFSNKTAEKDTAQFMRIL